MDARSVVQSYFDALAAKDLARVDALVSPSVVFVTPVGPLGKQELLSLFRAVWDAFPDWRYDHEALIAEDHVVSTTLHMTGTHSGTFVPPLRALRPVQATGKKVVLPGQQFVYHVEAGQITRIVPDADPNGGMPELLRQIGVRLPPLWLMRIVARIAGFVGR